MKRKKVVTIIVAVVMILLFLVGCQTEEIETIQIKKQYAGAEEIQIDKNTETVVAKIDIVDTYTKGGIKYREITTSVTGSEIYTYSEAEYDELFGLENDAFDCMVYSLKLSSNIIECNPSYLMIKPLDEFCSEDLLAVSAGDITFCTECFTPNSCIEWNAYCKTFSNQEADAVINKTENRVDSCIEVKRYSFLGGREFTEEEVNSYIQNLDTMNKHVKEIVIKNMSH